MKHEPFILLSICAAVLLAAFAVAPMPAKAQGDPPLNLARDGFFYIGGKTIKIDGKTFIAGQMYVEYRIPAKQTHPYPIIFVHGGTRSGANWTGTLRRPRRLGAVFRAPRLRGLCRRPAGPRPFRLRAGSLRPAALRRRRKRAAALSAAGKHKLWPQAHLHTQWPGTGEIDDPASQQIIGSFLPEIAFPKSVAFTREAMVQLLDKIGPSIMLVHSQGGPMGWPAAEARPDLVSAIVAVEPNGPPGRTRAIRRRAGLVQGRRRGVALRADAAADHLLAAGQGPGRASNG